eukprot:7683513-Pyramimonas_sp.AAC.1
MRRDTLRWTCTPPLRTQRGAGRTAGQAGHRPSCWEHSAVEPAIQMSCSGKQLTASPASGWNSKTQWGACRHRPEAASECALTRWRSRERRGRGGQA